MPVLCCALCSEFKCVSPTDAAENHNGYEYIRDHLGYRLELQSADWPTELSLPAKLNFSAMLLNWGFAAPVNPRPVHAVILSADKATVLWCSPSLADPRDWQPHIPGDPFYTPTRHAFGGSELAVTAADLAAPRTTDHPTPALASRTLYAALTSAAPMLPARMSGINNPIGRRHRLLPLQPSAKSAVVTASSLPPKTCRVGV